MSGDDRSLRDKMSRSRSRSNEDRRPNKRRVDSDPRDRHEMRLIIRARDAGAVIGRGGENVKRLRQEYKASITVTDSRTPERLIVIHADESGLEGVVKDVARSLFDLQNSRDRNSRSREESELKMLIHQSQAGCVIGKAGCKLKDLRREMQVDIKVYPECCPRSSERLVMVTGKPDLVAKCLVHVLLMLKTWPPRGVVDYYDPANYEDYLIPEYGGYYDDDDDGRRGRKTGSGSGRRDLSRSKYDERERGYGSRDREREYSTGLSSISMMLNNVRTTQQVSIPADLAGVIIGKSGSNIRKIRNETGADVDLDDAGGGKNDRIITINGTPEQIANAQYLLQMSVKQHLAKNAR